MAVLNEKPISIDEAIKQVCAHVSMLPFEELPVMDCLNRILSEDVYTLIEQPPFPRSAMDGYAVYSIDLQEADETNPVILPVVGIQYAGDLPFRSLKRGEALRIMTGAVIPEGADAVIPQEMTDYGETEVQCFEQMHTFQNYCAAGEDFPKGELLARAGDRVDAYLIAAATAGGVDTFSVRKTVRAAVITTGDELQLPGTLLKPGKIYNSNLALFKTRLEALGCQVIRAISAGDDLSYIVSAIADVIDQCDLIITTGGVSVGMKDLIPEAMEQLGADIVFHGIDVKPGMPTLFSMLHDVPVVGLSGNPYSAAAVFELLVQPIVKTMTAARQPVLRQMRAIAEDVFRGKSFCTRFLRGYYEDGCVTFAAGQKNGQTKAGIGTNCLVRIEPEQMPVNMGDQVLIYMM